MPERAAYFRASLIDEDLCKIADEFKRAALSIYRTRPQDAAYLFRRAEKAYDQAQEREQAQRCARIASRWANAAYLTLEPVNIPQEWESGQERQVVLELENHGNTTACGSFVRFAGCLKRRIWLQDGQDMPPGARIELETPITPSGKGALKLEIEIRYEESPTVVRNIYSQFPLKVSPAKTAIEIDGDVGFLQYMNSLPGRIKVNGSLGMVKVVEGPSMGSAKS